MNGNHSTDPPVRLGLLTIDYNDEQHMKIYHPSKTILHLVMSMSIVTIEHREAFLVHSCHDTRW